MYKLNILQFVNKNCTFYFIKRDWFVLAKLQTYKLQPTKFYEKGYRLPIYRQYLSAGMYPACGAMCNLHCALCKPAVNFAQVWCTCFHSIYLSIVLSGFIPVLSYPVLSCSILFSSVVSCTVWSSPVLSYPVPIYCLVLIYSCPFMPCPSSPVQSYPVRSVLSSPSMSCVTVSCPVPSSPVPPCSILSLPPLCHPVLPCPFLPCDTLFYPVPSSPASPSPVLSCSSDRTGRPMSDRMFYLSVSTQHSHTPAAVGPRGLLPPRAPASQRPR